MNDLNEQEMLEYLGYYMGARKYRDLEKLSPKVKDLLKKEGRPRSAAFKPNAIINAFGEYDED